MLLWALLLRLSSNDWVLHSYLDDLNEKIHQQYYIVWHFEEVGDLGTEREMGNWVTNPESVISSYRVSTHAHEQYGDSLKKIINAGKTTDHGDF